MAKNNQKCVRMSDDILKIVEDFKGDGFNEKFENLVIDFKKTIPQREMRLKDIDEKLKRKIKEIEQIEKKIYELNNLEFSLDTLKSLILKINKQVYNVSQITSGDPGAAAENEIQNKRLKKCIS